MTALLSIVIGAVAGLHISIWGMYKDAPHEGFAWTTFGRSVILAAVLGPFVARTLALEPLSAKGALLLFGCTYAVERAITEAWKSFFRKESQSKYTIPMQVTVLGRPIENRWVRRGLGVMYLAVIAVGVLALAAASPPAGPSGAALALVYGSLGGWFSAFGGAWKDAPVEGFQPLKFLRSPALAAGFAWPLSQLGGDLVQVCLAALGFTVATTETWKTFCFPSVPRGKFAGKPVNHPEMLRLRRRAVPAYVTIWGLLLAGFVIALLEAV